MKFLPALFAIVALAFATCKNESDDFTAGFGFAYFPLEVGKVMVYRMDSTIYDPTGDTMITLSTHFYREVTVDTFHDLSGIVQFRIEQYQRSADTLPWAIRKVLTQSLYDNKALRTEDNLRFIKLTFPLRKGNSWDGNVFFNPLLKVVIAGETLEMFKGWSYRTLAVDQLDTIGQFVFPEVATLQNADSENLIELRLAKEKYAKGVGLVYRELWILDTQCIEDCLDMPWTEKAEKGFILKQTLIDYR